MVFVLHSLHVVYDMYSFPDVESPLNLWDKSQLVVIYCLLGGILGSVWRYLVRIFASVSTKDIGPSFFFSAEDFCQSGFLKHGPLFFSYPRVALVSVTVPCSGKLGPSDS